MPEPPPYSRAHLDLDDPRPGLRSPWRELGLHGVALGVVRLAAGEGYTFLHTHDVQEEVYVVLAGEGVLRVGDEDLALTRGDLVRVSPATPRALCAGKQDLLVLVAGGTSSGWPRDPGARYLIDDGRPDYGTLPPWYAGREDVANRNRELAERMRRSRERRMGDEGGPERDSLDA